MNPRVSALLTLFALTAVSLAGPDKNVSGVPFPKPPAFKKADPAAYGAQLAAFADLYGQGYVDEVSRARMTLYDTGGDSVERTVTRMSLEDPKGGDKLVTRFLTPAEIKGVAALTHENSGSSDDNWLYLPANRRVRRISGANNTASFQGTEFTYEDLANLDHLEFSWRFLEETEIARGDKKIPVFKLSAKPTYKDTGYTRLVVYLDREHWRQERIEYYDLSGRLLKTRDATGWKQFHGRFWRATSIEMKNHQTRKRTVLKFDRFFVNVSLYKSKRTGKPRANLSPSLFTTRGLQK